ncbi:ABC transporter ATP-binding protein [Nocardioides sp. R-C-SC26]|uniref:ABC transporter ATP-binding protein n=1 Tax=Nocardioides sp. R-C-SC26 TaxID=2870414 RepID=UPI001E339FBC|nr:ABC transporter ATP-binding protein [Nocardioides sp. R-C-SC26]
MAAEPTFETAPAARPDGDLLAVRDLTATAALADRSLTLLDGVSIAIAPGEVLGVVGESGSGKTTLARAVVGLLERNVSIAGGAIELAGETIVAPGVGATDQARGRRVGMVFQGASRSLNPLIRVRRQLAEVLRRHEPGISRDDVTRRSEDVLREMRIEDPDRVLDSYPHQLSGGLRQRVAIALAVVTRPSLVIADECTTALDVTTQAEVVRLFRTLIDDLGLGLLFVTHDLMLASDLCDRIVVMSQGRVVESGPTAEVLDRPQDPYTRRLLAAVPTWTEGVENPHA